MNVKAEVAIHEAAHAVVAAVLGVRVRVVRALPLDLPSVVMACANPIQYEVTTERLLGLALMGDDMRTAPPEDRFAIKAAGELAVRLARMEPTEGHAAADYRDAVALVPKVGGPAWAQAALRRTAGLLERNAAPLATLAGALLERGIVSGAELDGLLRDVRGPRDRMVTDARTAPAASMSARSADVCGCEPPDGATVAWACDHGNSPRP